MTLAPKGDYLFRLERSLFPSAFATSATCWPTEATRWAAEATESRSSLPLGFGSEMPASPLRLLRRKPPRRFFAATAPAIPAAAAPVTISGPLARDAAVATARPAARVPAWAASAAATAAPNPPAGTSLVDGALTCARAPLRVAEGVFRRGLALRRDFRLGALDCVGLRARPREALLAERAVERLPPRAVERLPPEDFLVVLAWGMDYLHTPRFAG
jgi:hypothetical protein